MSLKRLKVVIMAGGKGERLWPKSTKQNPKQFCTITSDQAMLKDTYDRFLSFVPKENIYISINRDHEKNLKKSVPTISLKNVIIEPEARDTAASILLSLLSTAADDQDFFLFAPADHYIKNVGVFKKDIVQGLKLTDVKPNMTLFGINPTYPADGFGYIKIKPIKAGEKEVGNYQVECFVEKPTVQVAKRYLATKKYFWNSGLFMFKKTHLLSLFETHMPEDYKALERYLKTIKKNKKKYQLNKDFKSLTKISFDYAIVEKLKNINCVKARFDWDDVGSWDSLFRIKKTDVNKNILSDNVEVFQTADSICESEVKGKRIVLNGLSDTVVIDTKDVLYITHISQAHKIKDILKKNGS